jgi:hypothetical protein
MITRSVPAVMSRTAGEPERAHVLRGASWTTPRSHIHRIDEPPGARDHYDAETFARESSRQRRPETRTNSTITSATRFTILLVWTR